MNINIRYFAAVREAIGKESEQVQTAAATAADLRRELIARGEPWAQALAAGRAIRVAVDQVIGPEDRALHEGAEVAFFPPVTGG